MIEMQNILHPCRYNISNNYIPNKYSQLNNYHFLSNHTEHGHYVTVSKVNSQLYLNDDTKRITPVTESFVEKNVCLLAYNQFLQSAFNHQNLQFIPDKKQLCMLSKVFENMIQKAKRTKNNIKPFHHNDKAEKYINLFKYIA